MIAKSRFFPFNPITFLLHILVLITILTAQLSLGLTPPASAAPNADVLETLEDFFSLGKNTVLELEKAIKLASGEVKNTLAQLKRDIEDIMNKLETKFKGNLNYALSSLDTTTWTILSQLKSQIFAVNELLKEDIRLINEEIQEDILLASREIHGLISDLEQSLQRTVFAIGLTGAYLIDRATNNVMAILTLVMLGIGLLIFIWLFFTRQIPGGLARNLVFSFMVVYFVLFGSLTIPPVRVYAMAYSGVGLEQQLKEVGSGPHMFAIYPDPIVLGETEEVDVWGSRLLPENKRPTVTLAGIVLKVTAVSDTRVVVAIPTNLEAPEGSTNLTLLYDGEEGTTEVVTITGSEPPAVPPDLVIRNFVIEPSSPVENTETTTTIEVCNQGGSLAPRFWVQWEPGGGIAPLTAEITNLDVDKCQPASFVEKLLYVSDGTFDTVASVDKFFNIDEGEEGEGNNISTLSIIVQPEESSPPPPPATTRPPLPQPECPPRFPNCQPE